ncbi:hypothetical protein [Sphingomonas sp.]|uniref:hypothetical protein n=1 Tax=Sphingomonas sp. TaxID=28214 RepID=UPI001B1020BE|nr:hypothetical protein [Sphingomonas sp.]MBO9713093.1 hypothetical protein [Sphingomonas sp.]
MVSEDLEEAERRGKQRARVWPVLAGLLILQQWAFFTRHLPERLDGVVDYLDAGVWLLLVVVPLGALWTGGWIRPLEIRALIEDESTRANRASALALGFLFAILAATVLFVATLFTQVNPRFALNVVISAGIGSAMMRFGLLEWRDYAA